MCHFSAFLHGSLCKWCLLGQGDNAESCSELSLLCVMLRTLGICWDTDHFCGTDVTLAERTALGKRGREQMGIQTAADDSDTSTYQQRWNTATNAAANSVLISGSAGGPRGGLITNQARWGAASQQAFAFSSAVTSLNFLPLFLGEKNR